MSRVAVVQSFSYNSNVTGHISCVMGIPLARIRIMLSTARLAMEGIEQIASTGWTIFNGARLGARYIVTVELLKLGADVIVEANLLGL